MSEQAVIHDIRYSRFQGDLRPRPFAVLALARSSALRALGFRRSAGAKVWPFLLVIAVFFPAIIAVAVPLFVGDDVVASPQDVFTYSELVLADLVVVLAFIATTVPSLLTRERRERVLSLYFSTALSPVEYVLGKLLAAISLVLLVILGPLLLEFFGGLLSTGSPGHWLRTNIDDLPKIVAASLIVGLYHGLLALAIGSCTGRRVLAVSGYLGGMLIATSLAGVLQVAVGDDALAALNIPAVPVLLAAKVLDGDVEVPAAPLWVTWVLVVAATLGVLAFRYRKGHGA